ncbi:DNA-directed primase/polymerase protein [Strongyloides ratti]|uniref:DNA-directed primase/polymerase protein n=1 Tax=Strongyloides ratti TaxID=34506 RepID=A0A090LQJ1_STRRB|nr:DNA-directed primase/polymerase protein [Strongyloides ratti]CEF70451.1 DNA-directed primase/polymerase protein [Strongyloides ratti]
MKDKKNLRVFSYENPTTKCLGSRKYITTNLSKFVTWYLTTKKEIRNFYEIITIDTPCRLYFDIEYSKELNTIANSIELFNDFSNFVKDSLKSEYNIDININESFLVLDSSTSTKFSLHIIIHLPDNKLFLNNIEMKNFTDYLYLSMLENNIALIYNGKINNIGEKLKVPIFDNCVYTKNRNFRLYLSCKLGKNIHLKLADWCQFYKYKNINNPTDFQIFFDSLCVPKFFDNYETLPKYKINKEVLDIKTSKVRSNFGGLFYNTFKISNDFCIYLKNGYGRTSMFPLLEEYIIEKNKQYSENVDIRAWDIIKIKNNGKLKLIFHIKNCRYCSNIGREHKSNNIFWEVYFDPILICHQKCFDRECQGRYSIGYQIPTNVTEEVIKSLTEMELYQIPFDSFADSFWNLERDNVSLLDNEKIRKKSFIGDIDNNLQSKKHFTKLDNTDKSIENVQETSFNEDEDNFIVVDSKIPDKSTEYLNFIISTQQLRYKNSFEFSQKNLSEEENSYKILVNQKSNYNNISKSSLTQFNRSEDFMTDDESNDNLKHLTSLNASECDKFNECFINSTVSSSTDNSSDVLEEINLLIKDNQKNICILNEHGEIETILESPLSTSEINSPINNDNNIKKNQETETNTNFIETNESPGQSYCYGIPKTFKEIHSINKKFGSSEKCKSPFKSPVIKRKGKKMDIKKTKKNIFSIP